MRFYDDKKCLGYVNITEDAFLFEKDIEVYVGEVLHIDDDYYCVRRKLDDQRAVLLKVNLCLDDTETTDGTCITCPVCGHVELDSWEVDDGDFECHRCGAVLYIEKDVKVSYYAEVKELPEIHEVQ